MYARARPASSASRAPTASKRAATPEQKATARRALAGADRNQRAGRRKDRRASSTRRPATARRSAASRSIAASGWFAARPSGTEDIYKIYAESFGGAEHLQRILEEAQTHRRPRHRGTGGTRRVVRRDARDGIGRAVCGAALSRARPCSTRTSPDARPKAGERANADAPLQSGDAAHADDDALLDRLQRKAFDYFVRNTNPQNGLVADTTRPGAPSSIAVVGFALSAYPVGVERGWIDRADAVARTPDRAALLQRERPVGQPDATGHRGFYYHFLDMRTRHARLALGAVADRHRAADRRHADRGGLFRRRERRRDRDCAALADALYGGSTGAGRSAAARR